MLVPNGSASLLLLVSAEWCRHFRVAAVGHEVGGSERLGVVIVLWLVVMMRLLRHHVVLLVGDMDRLGLMVVAIEVAIRGNVLWMCNELVMLVEGCEFHWGSSRHATSEGRRRS